MYTLIGRKCCMVTLKKHTHGSLAIRAIRREKGKGISRI